MAYTDVLNTEWIMKLTDKVSQPLKQVMSASQKAEQQLNNVDRATKRYGDSIDNIKRKLDNLYYAQERTYDPKRLATYNREIARLESQLSRRQSYGMGGGGVFKGNMQDAFNALPGAGLLTNPYAIGGAAIAGGLAFGNQAADAALEWDKRIAKINTTAQLNPQQRAMLSSQLLSLGQGYTGGNITDVADAYEKIISQTNDSARAMNILQYSLKGAKGGFTDLITTGTALTSILENTKTQGAQAAGVLDVLFKAKQVGAGEFGDFARYLPLQIAAANGLGFDYRDIAGLYAYTTTKIPNAEVANTLVENLYGQLKTPERVKQLRKMGISVTGANGEYRGLYNVLNDIRGGYVGAMAKSPQAGSDYLMSVMQDRQAGQALGLILQDFDKLGKTLKDVRDAAGATQDALNYGDYGATKVEQATRKWEAFKIKLGEKLAPIKLDIITRLDSYLDNPLKGLFDFGVANTGTGAGLGGWIMKQAAYNQVKGGTNAMDYAAFGRAEFGKLMADPARAAAFESRIKGNPRAMAMYNMARNWYNQNNPAQPGGTNLNSLLGGDTKINGSLDKSLTDLTSRVESNRVPKYITVNINKLVERLEVQATPGSSTGNMQEEVTRALVDAVRNVEQGLGSDN